MRGSAPPSRCPCPADQVPPAHPVIRFFACLLFGHLGGCAGNELTRTLFIQSTYTTTSSSRLDEAVDLPKFRMRFGEDIWNVLKHFERRTHQRCGSSDLPFARTSCRAAGFRNERLDCAMSCQNKQGVSTSIPFCYRKMSYHLTSS